MKRSHAWKWRDDFQLMGFQICDGSFFWKPHLAHGASSPDSVDDRTQGLRGCWPWVWNSSEPSPPGILLRPLQPSSDGPKDLQVGEVTTLVGLETRYIVISFSIPRTISTALTLSGAYSGLCKTSRLFVLLLALKRTPSSCSSLLCNYSSPLGIIQRTAGKQWLSARWYLRPDFR